MLILGEYTMKKRNCKRISAITLLTIMMLGTTACGVPSGEKIEEFKSLIEESADKKSEDKSNEESDDSSTEQDSSSNTNDESEKDVKADDNESGSTSAIDTNLPIPSGTLNGVELEEISSFGISGTLGYEHDIFYSEDGDGYKLYTWDGKPIEGTYYAFEYLGKGLYEVRNKKDINSTGVIDINGNIIIPCEADVIKWVEYDNSNDDTGRYLKVAYVTEKTEDKEECYIYTTDDFISFNVSEGDEMYKGYARFYDTEKGSFVGDLKSEDKILGCIDGCGDYIVIKSDEDNVTRIYDESGTVVAEKPDVIGSNYYIMNNQEEETYDVYDGSGSKHATLEGINYFSSIYTDNGYFVCVSDEDKSIYDIDGNKIISFSDIDAESIYSEHNGIFVVKKNDGKSALINTNGDTIAEGYDSITITSSDCDSYFKGKKGDSYDLIGPAGVLIENVGYGSNVCYSNENEEYFVIADKAYSLKLNNPSAIADIPGLVSDINDNKIGVYEVFNGNQLIDYTFDATYSSEYYLYGKTGDTMHVYKVNYLYE